MSQTSRLLIFDLDGTLVESHHDLIAALNAATKTQDLAPISPEDAGHVVGQGALKMIERAYLHNGQQIEVGGTLHTHLLDLFLIHYEQNISDNTKFYPGVLTALDTLSDQGWQLAVCTNKYERYARKLLTNLSELDRFPVVTGGDTFAIRKPDPGHLVETAALAGIDPANCLMVGDSINDIAAAKAANIPVIAVDFGYSDVPVAQLQPDLVISHFDELGTAVDSLS